jgi:hypothetical protein
MENDQTLRAGIKALLNATQSLQCRALAYGDLLSLPESADQLEQGAMKGQPLVVSLSAALASRDYLTKEHARRALETLSGGTDAQLGMALKDYALRIGKKEA